jgi:hypothetical protein
MTGPPDEDRPGDPLTGATPHQHHDQQATRPDGAVCDSSAEADSPGAVEISFAEHLARIGYGTDTLQGAGECMSLCQQSPGSRFSSMVSVSVRVRTRQENPAPRSSCDLPESRSRCRR